MSLFSGLEETSDEAQCRPLAIWSGWLNQVELRCCNKECGILNNSKFCDNFNLAEILVVNEGPKFVLTAFGDMAKELLGPGDDITPTEEVLLQCPQILELKCHNNEIVKVMRN